MPPVRPREKLRSLERSGKAGEVTVTQAPLGTKHLIPRLPDPWLRRPRLNDRLSALTSGQVALVAAPAGSGKTSLLADWFTHDRSARGAWLTLDARDNDPGRLGGLVRRALGRQGRDHRDGEPDTVAIDRAFESLARSSERVVLVLDDVHELISRDGLKTLEHLVLRLPPSLAVVLATRADPPVGLARLRIEGRLVQLRMHDLACTRDEAADLFAVHGVTLDADATAALWARTEGWIAGLRLAALALASDGDHDRFVADATRTELVVSDYLLHEVLERQPREVQEFLLRTSMAEPLTVELADVLTESDDAAARLQDLERRGLFITALDGEPPVYRFHSLFGALLRARLRHDEPTHAEELLRRAATWFADHDMPAEAELHARAAGDWELAGGLACTRWVRAALGSPEVRAVPAINVPEIVSEQVASLSVLETQRAVLDGDRPRANRWRSRADAVAREGEWDGEIAIARLLVDVLYGRAFGTDVRSLRALSTLLQSGLVPSSGPAVGIMLLRRAELLLDGGDLDAGLSTLLDARWSAHRVGPDVVDECDALLALLASARGRLRAAERFLDAREADYRIGADAAFARRLARVMCDAQRGRVRSARSTLAELDASPALCHAVRIVYDELVEHLVTGMARKLDLVRAEHPLAAQVRIALGAFDESDARDLGSAEQLVARARHALTSGRPDQVLALLGGFDARDEPRASSSGPHPRTLIEACCLAAIAADRVDDVDAAMAALRRACTAAVPGDLRGPFVAHAADLAPVLERYAWRLAPETIYAVELVDALQRAEPPVFVEPLTERERAVLEYLPTMMSNTEIAHQLLVSVNTVKTHLKSVYRKLGVDRRRDAVLRGRQLEII
jgi:LuxR family transcriptional regulator, maltose regulon positive regulatory protein